MALTGTVYNEDFNDMPFAYLRIKRTSRFIASQTPQQVPASREEDELCDCCDVDKRYIHLALADVSDSDTYKNDYASFLFDLPVTSGATCSYILQKYTGSGWLNTVTLDSTYGTTYAPGIFTDRPNFCGYIMQWRPVLSNHGSGFYRVRFAITVLGTTTVSYSEAYCLKPYSEAAADKTLRFEWNNNGIVTYADDDFVMYDYGNINWMAMIRVRGAFGFTTDEQEKVELDFYDGSAIKTETIHDKINYKYKFKSGPLPFFIHSVLKNIAFKSNSLTVTTYGKYDKKDYERKAIIKDSNGYSPNYDYVYRKWFGVEVDFKDKYNDLGFRKDCAPSGENCQPVTILNEAGETITTIPSGGIYVDNTSGGDNVAVSNSNDTYSASPSCGGSLELPDTTVNIYIDGVLRTTTTVVTLDSSATINLFP